MSTNQKVEMQGHPSGNPSTTKRLVSSIENGKIVFSIEIREPSDTKWWKWGKDFTNAVLAIAEYHNVMEAQ